MARVWIKHRGKFFSGYFSSPYSCNMGRPANKPRQWKSMLTHQGRFICLYTPTFTWSKTTEFVICISIYIRDLIPSHSAPSVVNSFKLKPLGQLKLHLMWSLPGSKEWRFLFSSRNSGKKLPKNENPDFLVNLFEKLLLNILKRHACTIGSL